MDYCGERGIPHSRFLGREDGPDWLPSDRAKVLAWRAYRNAFCPGCGTAAWEWEPSQGGSKHAYMPIKVTCEGCNRKDHLRDDSDPKGTYVYLVPHDVYMDMEMRKDERG